MILKPKDIKSAEENDKTSKTGVRTGKGGVWKPRETRHLNR